ncbi:MAG: DUF4886 domain-containing protein [Opitutae bacterium]|jgi:hypothetical protein|nr:DUF4886 domain-containing protein [Opitutae bacterium]MBT4223357.1 DUF4886 domain-containing protein [Opitutae bacterium]MBT5379905.1 DUF4886 domain-containing protein [Opitutae bacterium]MBT5690265.1 DUF4886 domain-containing protein [Opitutae bacterium]MBT6461343.1 DUF4886 domain-containing protein [Opitutae bacterium]
MKYILLHSLIAALLVATPSRGPAERDNEKVLFLGNSYTAQSAHFIREVFKKEAPGFQLSFLTPGGVDIKHHLENQKSQKLLALGQWDFVVLQEQSQKAGLGGQFSADFHKAVAGFVPVVRKQGGKVCLFMTWGRRDGDKRNPSIYPDFKTMHNKVSGNYLKAAKTNGLLLAPVGKAFEHIHATDRDLFQKLYKKDGSHPDKAGGFLVACVFFKALTGRSPEGIRWDGGFNSATAAKLRKAAVKAFDK